MVLYAVLVCFALLWSYRGVYALLIVPAFRLHGADFRRVVALPGRIGYGFGLSSNASFTMALWLSVRCLVAFSSCLCTLYGVTV